MDPNLQKNDKGPPVAVAVDGTRVRTIREAKKLTQLYVANVVGVTTDTISRWENNRYPSIRRENAEKLAAALEVEIQDILRREEAETVAPPAPPLSAESAVRTARFWLLSGFAILVLLLAGLYLFLHRAAPAPTAVRRAPHFAAPGTVVPVQVKVTRRQGENSGFILKEQLPEGIRLVGSIPARSSSDSLASSVKWFIPAGSASVTVSYTIQVPVSVPLGKALKLHGEIVLRSAEAKRNEAISGDDTIRIGAYHWADSNGDGRIDDDEIMPAYYVCEDMKGLGLDWKTIEEIWSGKGYRWEPERGFIVVK
jgi:transcriptional regulator with XRE-family HTH domain